MEDEQMETLISLYRAEENLWNRDSPHYFNRRLNRISLLKVASIINKDWSVETVKKKIQCLRTQYSRELQKVRRSIRCSKVSDDIYVPRWRWFSAFDAFLRPHVLSRKIISVNSVMDEGKSSLSYDIKADDNDQDDEMDGVADDTDMLQRQIKQERTESDVSDYEILKGDLPSCSQPLPPSTPSSHLSSLASCPSPSVPWQSPEIRPASPINMPSKTKKKKRDPSQVAVELLEKLVTLQNSKSLNASFGQFIVAELDRMTPAQQCRAKLEIHKVLYALTAELDSA